jgi:hypothetical protein
VGLWSTREQKEGEGHGHLAGRASEAVLTRRGADGSSKDTPGGGGDAPIAGLHEKQKEGAMRGRCSTAGRAERARGKSGRRQ